MTVAELIKRLDVEDMAKEIKVVDTGDFSPLTHIYKTDTSVEIHTMVQRVQVRGCHDGVCEL